MLILARLGIRLHAASIFHWIYSKNCSYPFAYLFWSISLSLAQLLEGFSHDLPEDSPTCSAKTHFLKNIRIFYLALFQLPILLSPGSSLSCFLKKHSWHQSPYANYLTFPWSLLPKTPSDRQVDPLERYPGKMTTAGIIVLKRKDLYLFDLCWLHGFSLLLEIMHLCRSWT